jgi:photosystem II stability/assembly factor-like uncharacterized protein
MKTKTTLFKKLFLVVLIGWMLTGVDALAQKYLEIARNSSSKDFASIVQEAENYYEKNGLKTQEDMDDEGSEYNQFQRWKYFNKSRLSNGLLQNAPKRTVDAITQYNKSGKNVNARMAGVSTGNWSSLGPITDVVNGGGYSNGLGRVNCIAFDPSDTNVIYVGAPSGGLWRSTNGGAKWVPLTDNYLATIGVSGIAIDPLSPVNNRTIYIYTGDGDGGSQYSIGVLKSIDNGNTWNATGFTFSYFDYKSGYKLVIHPAKNQVLYAATNMGIYKTSDAGKTWALKSPSTTIFDIEFKPGNPTIMYASGNGEFYRSTNAGDSWVKVSSGLLPGAFSRMEISVTPANPNYVYLLDGTTYSSPQFGGVYRSSDSGLNFNVRATTPNIIGISQDGNSGGSQSWYDLALAASPLNAEEIHVGGNNCWKSNDGGAHWINTSFWISTVAGPDHYTHADIHALEFNGKRLFCGSDGGIYKSNNSANTWADISKGLSISQIYRIAVDPSDANRIICGAQDNGMNNLIGGVYNQWFGADGFEGFVDPVTPTTIYGEYQNGGLLKSTDNGQSVNFIRPSGAGNGSWLTPYLMDPTDHLTLYAGFADIWKSTDAGSSWINLTGGLVRGSDYTQLIAVAPSNNQYVYAIKGGAFIRSHDGGKTWTDKATSQTYRSAVSNFAVNPDNPNEVWITIPGYSTDEKVFKTLNGGDTWTNISGTLPNVSINTIVFQKGSSGVYIGSDMGVFYKDNTLTDWMLFSTGLPRTIVNDLKIYYPGNKLRAGTYGRGVFESDLAKTSCAPDLTVNLQSPSICQGGQDTIKVSGNSNTYSWSPASGLNITSGAIVVASPMVTTSYTVTGMKTGCPEKSTKTVTVVVNKLPVVKVTPTQASICKGDKAMLNASGAMSYLWSPATGLSSTTDPFVLASPTVSTTYTVSGTDNNGCVNSAKVVVSVVSNCGMTVWFKKPANIHEPKIHYWNVSPAQPGTTWDGVFMMKDPAKGVNWYKYTIKGATSASLLFHDANGYKTPDQKNSTSGCFDGNTGQWVACDADLPPTISVNPKGGNYTSEVNACITVKDDIDSMVKFYVTIDGTKPTTSLTPNTNYFCLSVSKALRLWVLAVDSKGNQTYDIEDYTFNPSSGVQVWFKKPFGIKEPKIHYWNVNPAQAGTLWDGVFMTKDPAKGADWYTFTINNATSTSLLFHDANGYKTADQNNITGGCFDGNTNQWINCNADLPPVITVKPKGGNYSGAVNACISATDDKDPNVTFYYTTDGSQPNTGLTPYTNFACLNIANAAKLWILAVDSKGNQTFDVEEYTFNKNTGVTVWFKKPSTIKEPKIHYWNVNPAQNGTNWDGVFMIKDSAKGADWYKYTISGAISASLLFHDANGYKTADLLNITGGCFDGNTKKWVACSTPNTTSNILLALENKNLQPVSFEIAPNPAMESFSIDYSGSESKTLEVKILDILGKELLKEAVVLNEGRFSKLFKTDNFLPGIYFVSINNGRTTITKKLVIN